MKSIKRLGLLSAVILISIGSIFFASTTNNKKSPQNKVTQKISPDKDKVVVDFGKVKLDKNKKEGYVLMPAFDPNDKVYVTSSYGESWLGGGKWTYGISKDDNNAWSRYKNSKRVHSTRVKNGRGEVSTDEDEALGQDAIASRPATKYNNQAWAWYK